MKSSIYTKVDFITKIFSTDCTVHFMSFNSPVQLISLDDVMTSSVSLDADWPIVTQLPDAVNTYSFSIINMNGRVVHLQYIDNGRSVTVIVL